MKKSLATVIITATLVLSGQLAYIQTSKWVVETKKSYSYYRDLNSSLLKQIDEKKNQCNYKLDVIPTTDPNWSIERDIAKECLSNTIQRVWKLSRPVVHELEKGRTKYKIAKMLDWME
jgi:hypothetical protein